METDKISVNHHAGQVLIESESSREFLCNIYDSTYPIKAYRGKINLIGGGKNLEDISSFATIQREINEEFSFAQNTGLDKGIMQASGGEYDLPQIGERASREDVESARANILENLVPYQDFLANFSFIEGGPILQVPRAIFSVFYSRLPQRVFEMIKRNINSRKNMINDGFLKITNIHHLVSGDILTSWACGRTFEYYLGCEIPFIENVGIKPLGKPRKSYKDYLKEFLYTKS